MLEIQEELLSSLQIILKIKLLASAQHLVEITSLMIRMRQYVFLLIMEGLIHTEITMEIHLDRLEFGSRSKMCLDSQ